MIVSTYNHQVKTVKYNNSPVAQKAGLGLNSSAIDTFKKTEPQINFKGGLSSLFGKIFSKTAQSVMTEQDAVKALAKKEFGAYGLTQEGYKFITPDDYKKLEKTKSVSEIIIKNSPSRAQVTTGDFEGKTESTIYSYRNGISPLGVLDAIDNGFKKLTFIVDDGLQILTLPNNASKAKRAFSKSGYIEAQQYVQFI